MKTFLLAFFVSFIAMCVLIGVIEFTEYLRHKFSDWAAYFFASVFSAFLIALIAALYSSKQ